MPSLLSKADKCPAMHCFTHLKPHSFAEILHFKRLPAICQHNLQMAEFRVIRLIVSNDGQPHYYARKAYEQQNRHDYRTGFPIR